MTYTHKAVRVFLLIMVSMLVSSNVLADDRDDVINFVKQWTELEMDLATQSELLSDDRTWIFGSNRITDQALNLEIQLTQRAAVLNQDPGWNQITYAEDAVIKLYGDIAVVSIVYITQVIPGNALPRPINKAFVTLVLNKESGSWKIDHMHGSPIN